MSTMPARDDEFTRNEPDIDPLGEIYAEQVTPDIEEMTEHAEHVARDARTEPDKL